MAQQVSQGRDDTTQDPKEQDNDEDSIDEHPELAELDQHLVDGRERMIAPSIGPKRVPIPPKASITRTTTSTWANPRWWG